MTRVRRIEFEDVGFRKASAMIYEYSEEYFSLLFSFECCQRNSELDATSPTIHLLFSFECCSGGGEAGRTV